MKLVNIFQRVSFNTPETADIIIFDETNANVVMEIIPKVFSTIIFKVRPVEINITPIIFFTFILNLKDFKIRECFKSRRGVFYKVFWQLQNIYIKSDLVSRKPKAIITFIDNCAKFSWLSGNFHNTPCIAIQNGFRLSYNADAEYTYYCQHLFCFGGHEVTAYPKMGYKVDNFYPVGSLNLANNFEMALVGSDSTRDLLIVSCWRGNIGYQEDVADSMKAMRIMDELLSRYLKLLNLRAGVILRSERDSDQWVMPEIGMSEEEYYKSIYGDSIEIIDVNFSDRNIYPVMQSASMIVAGFSTTCLIEAYAMGKKVIYGNFCDTDKYHVDFKSEIVFKGNGDSYDLFSARLDALHTISYEDYLRGHKEIREYYIQNPLTSSTRDEIRRHLSDIVFSESSITKQPL